MIFWCQGQKFISMTSIQLLKGWYFSRHVVMLLWLSEKFIPMAEDIDSMVVLRIWSSLWSLEYVCFSLLVCSRCWSIELKTHCKAASMYFWSVSLVYPLSGQFHISPVHVVLVSLLVDQLSGLFLTFFGWPKKFVQSQGIFGQSLIFLWSGSDFLVY